MRRGLTLQRGWGNTRLTRARPCWRAAGPRHEQLGLPTVLTFEGGYAVAEVGVNTVNVLEGLGC